MKPICLALLPPSAIAWLAVALPACAAPQDVKLPPETIRLRQSDLPGYKIAMQKCAVCHSTDYISYQPPGMSLAQWTAEMTKMQRGYGAPISDAEVKQLAAYLAVAYGSAKASDPDVVAVVREAQAPGR